MSEAPAQSSGSRVFLVEDHSALRQSMALMLEAEGFEVVGEAGSLEEARREMNALQKRGGAELAILDLNLPDGEGVALIGEFRRAEPEFAALVLTASLDRSEHARAVESGAAAVLHKSADLDEIVNSLRRLAAGEALMSREELAEMTRFAGARREEEREARERVERLTRRETEVLRALAKGKSNKEIAASLHMSVDTERTHMVNILNKLGVHSRIQALVYAARYGLVDL